MYTCWNTIIDARTTNYGTRIDYILISRGLEKWISGADIWPYIYGSDHCPVVLELHDTIIRDGVERRLVDELHGRSGADPIMTVPKIAASLSTQSQPKLFAMLREQRATGSDRQIPESDRPTRKRRAKNLPQQPLTRFITRHGAGECAPAFEHSDWLEYSPIAPSPASSQAPAQWNAIFTAPPPPGCTLHREPARAWTVKKSGPNQGRKFWLCARPVGPGYKERARNASSREFRCDFFMWDSEWRRRQRGHLATT